MYCAVVALLGGAAVPAGGLDIALRDPVAGGEHISEIACALASPLSASGTCPGSRRIVVAVKRRHAALEARRRRGCDGDESRRAAPTIVRTIMYDSLSPCARKVV